MRHKHILFTFYLTKGFGDYVPDDKKFACATAILVLFGLSVVSMAINVIQMKVDMAFDELLMSIEEDFKVGEERRQITFRQIEF